MVNLHYQPMNIQTFTKVPYCHHPRCAKARWETMFPIGFPWSSKKSISGIPLVGIFFCLNFSWLSLVPIVPGVIFWICLKIGYKPCTSWWYPWKFTTKIADHLLLLSGSQVAYWTRNVLPYCLHGSEGFQKWLIGIPNMLGSVTPVVINQRSSVKFHPLISPCDDNLKDLKSRMKWPVYRLKYSSTDTSFLWS